MNNAFLQIIGKNGDADPIEFLGECSLEKKGNDVYITYLENKESGMTNTETCIAISDEIFSITRVGDYSTSMVFEREKEFQTQMQTPYGAMYFSLFCDKLDISKKEKEVKADLGYIVTSDKDPVKNTINLVCKIY